jgi:hypothetical protein
MRPASQAWRRALAADGQHRAPREREARTRAIAVIGTCLLVTSNKKSSLGLYLSSASLLLLKSRFRHLVNDHVLFFACILAHTCSYRSFLNMINAHKILDSVYRKTRAVYFPKVYLACVLMSSGRQNQTPLKVNILSKRSGCNEGRIRSQAQDICNMTGSGGSLND